MKRIQSKSLDIIRQPWTPTDSQCPYMSTIRPRRFAASAAPRANFLTESDFADRSDLIDGNLGLLTCLGHRSACGQGEISQANSERLNASAEGGCHLNPIKTGWRRSTTASSTRRGSSNPAPQRFRCPLLQPRGQHGHAAGDHEHANHDEQNT